MAQSEIAGLFEYYIGVHCYTQSPKTVAGKRSLLEVFLGFLQHRGYDRCGRSEIADFIRHAQFGHLEPDGRWGRAKIHPRYIKPTRPRTAQLYFDYLKAFLGTLVADGHLPSSPMDGLKRPGVPREEIVPFSREQYELLLESARVGRCPERDYCLLTLMFDTGLRLEEVTRVRKCDIDLKSHTLQVLGKRNKKRLCMFGDETARALLIYFSFLSSLRLAEDEPIFRCSRRNAGQPLAPAGVYRIFKRHGKAAGLQNVRCSPHTLRHTFATEFMLLGASQRAVMHQMGHENSDMSLKYQHVVDAQMAIMHKKSSPADNLKRTVSTRVTARVAKPCEIPKGGRPRQPIESFPCSCSQCPERPKKACKRGNVLIKRAQREKQRLAK